MKFRIWKIDEFRKLHIYSEQVFGNWKKKIQLQEMKVFVVSHFEPLGLRCEMTLMPLHLVSRRERVVSEL